MVWKGPQPASRKDVGVQGTCRGPWDLRHMHRPGESVKVPESPDCQRERPCSEAAGDSNLESF